MVTSYQKHKSIIIFSIATSFIFLIFYISYLEVGSSFKLFQSIKSSSNKVINPIKISLDKFLGKLPLQLQAVEQIHGLQNELNSLRIELAKYKNLENEINQLKLEKQQLQKQLNYKKNLAHAKKKKLNRTKEKYTCG